MSPQNLKVDAALSWARGDGDAVSVRLRLPGAGLPSGTAVVELVGPEWRVRADAAVTAAKDAVDVAFTVPRRDLGSSAWRVTIESPDTDAARFVPVNVRVLAAPGIPVALLLGPTPTTKVFRPRRQSRLPQPRHLATRLPTPVQQVLRGARDRGRAVVGRWQGSRSSS